MNIEKFFAIGIFALSAGVSLAGDRLFGDGSVEISEGIVIDSSVDETGAEIGAGIAGGGIGGLGRRSFVRIAVFCGYDIGGNGLRHSDGRFLRKGRRDRKNNGKFLSQYDVRGHPLQESLRLSL